MLPVGSGAGDGDTEAVVDDFDLMMLWEEGAPRVTDPICNQASAATEL